MADNIIGNNDRPGGGNDTYNIPGRGTNIPREQLIQEIGGGKHPNFSTVEINGEKFVRAKPDGTTNNNVNRDS